MDTKDFNIYYRNILKLTKATIVSTTLGSCTILSGNQLIFVPLWGLGIISKILVEYNKNKCANCFEYETLRTSYEYVLNHLISLCQRINFTDIEEVYTLFEYLYFNNYLSYNKSNKKDIIEILPSEASVQAPLALNNHGLCRNKALALANLYQGLDINAGVLPGIYIDINYQTNDIKKYLQKEIRKHKDGNHAITVVNHNNKTYYLDASLHHPYFEDKLNPDKLSDGKESLFLTRKRINNKYSKDLEGLIKREYPCADYCETLQKIDEAKVKLMDYSQTLDNFHQDINSILEEAENAYQSLRKSIR